MSRKTSRPTCASTKYTSLTQIEKLINSTLNSLLRTLPSDPFAFLAGTFQQVKHSPLSWLPLPSHSSTSTQ